MIKDEAIKVVAMYSQLQTGGLNKSDEIAISEMIELAKRRLLYYNNWTFARGKVHVNFPYLFLYKNVLDTLHIIETISGSLYQYDNILKYFDFFYLKEQYSIEEIIEFYKFLQIYNVCASDGIVHNFGNSLYVDLTSFLTPETILDTTGLNEYFDFYISFCKSQDISVYGNYAYIFDNVGGLSRTPSSILEAVSFEKYKEALNIFLNTYYKKYVAFINNDNEKTSLFYQNIDKDKFTYTQNTDIDCTLNKDIPDLPEMFMDIVCRTVAKDKLVAMGKLDQANVMQAEVSKQLERYIIAERSEGDPRSDLTKYKSNDVERRSVRPYIRDGKYYDCH